MLSALSLVLNGGGVAQLKTINVKLTRAMSGHEDDIRDAISQLDTFVGGLDQHKADVVRAIDGLDRLSARLEAQKGQIAAAVDDLGPGLKVLADQRGQLTSMLAALSNLGRVGTRVVNASKADTVANLRALNPILSKLSEAGTNLPGALEMLVTYPFPQAATDAVQGDYTNLRITADLDLRSILTNLQGSGAPALPATPPPHPAAGTEADRPGRTSSHRAPHVAADRAADGAPHLAADSQPLPPRPAAAPASAASAWAPRRPRRRRRPAPTTPTWPG